MRLAILVLALLSTWAAGLEAAEPVDSRLQALLRQLTTSADDEDGIDARISAVFELRELGTAAKPAEPYLRELLGHEDPRLRRETAVALVRLGAKFADILPLLTDSDRGVQFCVAEELLAGGISPDTVIPVLLRCKAGIEGDFFEKGSLDVICALSSSLLQSAMPSLVQGLQDRDETVREAATEMFDALPPVDRRFVPRIAHLLRDDRPDVWDKACRLLVRVGADAKAALPALRDRLSRAQFPENLPVAAALAAIGPEDEAPIHLQCLIRALGDKEAAHRDTGVRWLTAIGDRARPAAGPLVDVLCGDARTEDERLIPYGDCFKAVIKGGNAAVPHLIATIRRDEPAAVRRTAIRVLQGLGRDASAGIPALVQAIADETSDVELRIAALSAIAEIGPPESCVPVLLAQCRSPSAETRRAAAQTLAHVPRLVEESLERLTEMLRDEVPSVRIAAAQALTAQNVQVERVAIVLGELLSEEDGNICIDALWALNALGARAAPALPQLMRVLAFRGAVAAGLGATSISAIAVYPLSRIGASAVCQLQQALESEDVNVRGLAARALGDIGPAEKGSVDGLRALLQDVAVREEAVGCTVFQITIREEAVRALGRIGPDAAAVAPDLIALLKQRLEQNEEFFDSVAISLIAALGNMRAGGEAAVPILEGILQVHDGSAVTTLHGPALHALTKIAPTSRAALPGIVSIVGSLRSEHPVDFAGDSGCERICQAAVALGSRAEALVPLLKEMYATWPVLHPSYRCCAARAVALLRPNENDAIEYLRIASHHPDETIASQASEYAAEVTRARNNQN